MINMKQEYSHSYNTFLRNKRRKQRKRKTILLLLLLMIIMIIINLVFVGSSPKVFFKYMAIELGIIAVAGVILFLSSVVFSTNKTKNTKRNTVEDENDDEIKFSSFNATTRPSTATKLKKQNYNWTGEDIVRKRKVYERSKHRNNLSVNTQTENKKFVPYRSPFDPINKPEQKVKEVEIKNDVKIEEIKIVHVDGYNGSRDNEMQKGQANFEEQADLDAAAESMQSNYSHEEMVSTHELEDNKLTSIMAEPIEEGYCNTAEIEEQTEEDKTEEHYENQPVEQQTAELHIIDINKSTQDNLNNCQYIEAACEDKYENNVESKRFNQEYVKPPIEILNMNSPDGNEAVEQLPADEKAKKLIETLESFGVGAKVIDVTHGPSVTRYELQPNAGIKVSKIVNLADDIALNLAATAVRIEAPIPGKAAIGIEIPNKEVTPVLLSDVIGSEEFHKHPSKLAFAVGKDVSGNPVIGDISRMPHLLIAGATGSGKSVCINTLIASILYKATPSEVKLLMIDPKVVELGIYNGIPHLLIPVVTDPKKAAGALNWAVQEMTMRYKLFADNNVRDLKGYNKQLKAKGDFNTLPQIVIIIDELADLMMAAPNEVEDCICRLAQMARAAGMHLVIATQRPSVDVITGVIKANIPSRIAFAVSSQIDSRTILDMSGAEKLLGRGDMLFYPAGMAKPVRVQGSFVSDNEVEDMVDHIKSNMIVEYDEDIIQKIDDQAAPAPGDQNSSGDDELLSQAIEMVIDHGQASASLIQRKFKVGYARAARILDQMETWGVVSTADGSKPRQILITKQEWHELNA